MRRTSIMLDESDYEVLEQRAKCSGTSVSQQIRLAVARLVDEEDDVANQRWLAAAEEIIAVGARQPGPHLDVDSDEAKLEMTRAIYRDAMNREPDF